MLGHARAFTQGEGEHGDNLYDERRLSVGSRVVHRMGSGGPSLGFREGCGTHAAVEEAILKIGDRGRENNETCGGAEFQKYGTEGGFARGAG